MSLDTVKNPRVRKQKKHLDKEAPYNLGEFNTNRMSNRLFFLIVCWPLLILLITVIMFSCTLAITNVHTQGKAQDVGDDQQTTDPTTSPTLTIPVKGV